MLVAPTTDIEVPGMTEVFDYWARTHRHAPRDATSRGIASAMKLTLLVALAALALPGLSRAGGLYLGDFGTPSMGTAGAGANARADDASAAFHGPAGMTRLDEHQLMLGAAPGFATVKFDPDAGTPTPGTNGGQQGGFIPILSSHYVHKLSDRWRFGVSLVSISGSVLDPSDDWVGRNEIVEVSLFTLTLVPSLAYRVNDWLSLGAGVGFSYGRLNFDVRAPGPLGLEIEIDDADDFAVTGVVSALVELSPELRVGIVYQSETEFDLSGDVNVPAGVSARIDLELPLAQAVRLGIYWDATDRLALLASGAWEDWSTAGDLPVSVGPGCQRPARVRGHLEGRRRPALSPQRSVAASGGLQLRHLRPERIATARRPSRSTGSSATPSVSNTIGVSSRASVCPSSGSTWATRG